MTMPPRSAPPRVNDRRVNEAAERSILPPADFPQVDHPWSGLDDGHNCETCIETGDDFHKCDRMAHVTADLRRVQDDEANRAAAENLQRNGSTGDEPGLRR